METWTREQWETTLKESPDSCVLFIYTDVWNMCGRIENDGSYCRHETGNTNWESRFELCTRYRNGL